MAELVAQRLRDPELVRKARVFPYQLMVAYVQRGRGACRPVVRDALQDAMEIAIANVPRIERQGLRLPGRLGLDAVAGHRHRKGATTAVRCIDVAALVAAAIAAQATRARRCSRSRTRS